MNYRPKVYTASKLWHAPLWRMFRDRCPQFEFTSRWIEHVPEMEANAGPADFGHYWTMDIHDVVRSDFLICFAGPSYEAPDPLKGAFVEAGAMLGSGHGYVLAVNCPTDWSWTYHPKVVRFLGLTEAENFLMRYVIERTPRK